MNAADETDFAAFVANRSTALLSFAHALTGDRHDAEGGGLDERDAMWRVLATLPARQRAVLVLPTGLRMAALDPATLALTFGAQLPLIKDGIVPGAAVAVFRPNLVQLEVTDSCPG